MDCVGVALAPDHGKDAERLIKSAELALAKGKSEGRARVRFFSADLDAEMTDRLRLERAIDTALATGGFALHFQPLYSEPGEALVGFEALARLPTADGRFIPPSEFIPAAERMGAINRSAPGSCRKPAPPPPTGRSTSPYRSICRRPSLARKASPTWSPRRWRSPG